MQLSGARVLLTGASRGIGAELARALAARGADLHLVARDSPALHEVARTTGGTAHPCDLNDLAALPGLVEQVGPLDVLVNNAGVSGVGWFLDRTDAELDAVLTVNLHAPIRLCRLVLPGMVERRHGHVVNLSSMAAVFAPPGLATYGATKAGLAHFSAGLRADLRDTGVRVTTVTLGSVTTDMDDQARTYGPLRELAEKSQGRDLTPMPVLIDKIVTALEQGTAQVRVPPAMAPLAMLVEAPRAVGRLVFRRAMASERRSDQPG